MCLCYIACNYHVYWSTTLVVVVLLHLIQPEKISQLNLFPPLYHDDRSIGWDIFLHLTKTRSIQQHLPPNHYTPLPRHHHHQPLNDRDTLPTKPLHIPTNNRIHYSRYYHRQSLSEKQIDSPNKTKQENKKTENKVQGAYLLEWIPHPTQPNPTSWYI